MLSNIDLINSGLSLVPIPLGLKKPLTPCWNEFKNVISTLSGAVKLQDGNIGLAHAYCTPEPTCAIDVDNYKESKIWLKNHGIDLGALLFADDAVAIWSGKKNSLKLLYRLPIGNGAIESTQIKSKDASMMLEFRCAASTGKTMQDVLPPSVHPSGTTYQWVGAGTALHIPVIPDALLKLWRLLLVPKTKQLNNVRASISTPENPRQIARVQSMLDFIDADCGYFEYRDIVWSVISTAWKCNEYLAMTWCKSAPDRYDEANFYNTVNSFNPKVANPITLGTLTFKAKQKGWV
jgi:hypothetical protein